VQLFAAVEQIAMKAARLVGGIALTFHAKVVVAICAVASIALLQQRATTEREAILMRMCRI